jgi:sugar phosphate isomerase/epimerase
VAPKIFFGVNLSFAKYVFGRKRALEVVRRQLGLRYAELVADNDFGPVFYLRSPEAFRQHHYEVADHAAAVGVRIPSVFTFYRDTGAIAHVHREIRESAYLAGLALIEQAACCRTQFAGASLFTMSREIAEDPERFQAQFDCALEIWRQWLADARRLGVPRLLVATASTFREGCATIDDTRTTLRLLDEHHEKNPDTTARVGLCYNTGHGISASESRDDSDRDFRAWFRAFPDRIHQVHLRNTDPEFVEAWHFRTEGGIIDAIEVLRAVRDTLTLPEVYLYLQVPGRRGHDRGERRAIDEHVRSVEVVHDALRKLGYRYDEHDHGWTTAESGEGGP